MEWKVEYGLILFLAFAGVTYRLTQGKMDSMGTIMQRVYAQFYAFLFTVVLYIGLLLMIWGWHIVIVCIATLLLAPVSERFIWLWMQSQNSSKSVWQYIKRFRKTWDAMEQENSTNNENPTDQ
ncbi:hypothetical protein GO755_26430 [Spirosoma sp. HMF4905]|uniref:Uncharacterized protein n=1 Tax=Spirosoma arboris TaxID=2682092 RepID=A0A7K1SIK1_9BACT|nr:hypothetical protein [Spirosoma arboris]MVM33603.1 hypothetical protein [Spirosoma arboris]